jgi:hypothetical protein
MTIERFMTTEYNRYVKGKGAPGLVIMLVNRDLYEAWEANLMTLDRWVDGPVNPDVVKLAFKTARMYKLHQPGWMLVIEGKHGRQVSEYTGVNDEVV